MGEDLWSDIHGGDWKYQRINAMEPIGRICRDGREQRCKKRLLQGGATEKRPFAYNPKAFRISFTMSIFSQP